MWQVCIKVGWGFVLYVVSVYQGWVGGLYGIHVQNDKNFFFCRSIMKLPENERVTL